MPLPVGYVSNDAATIRSIQRVFSKLFHYSLNAPAALVANGYKTTVAGPNTATKTYFLVDGTLDGSLAGLPDFPRSVIVTVTHATSIVALSGTIFGEDLYGNSIQENWAVTATGTSKTYETKQAFAKVTEVTVTAAADASADSVVVGTGDTFGLPLLTTFPQIVAELEDGAAPTAGVVVPGSSTAGDDRLGTYKPNTAPNGTHVYDVVVICDDPEAT